MKYGTQLFISALMAGGVFICTVRLPAQEAAFFREINGTVEVKAPGSTAWVSAAVGDRVENRTVISTGFKSTAALVVGNSVITVRPVTRLTLEEMVRSREGEQVSLRLQTGRIRADVKPPVEGNIAFTVRSPIATASVRGTSFEFDTETLRVAEGRVAYSLDNGRGVYVAAGGMSYVDETGNTVVDPFDAAVELLTPAPPPGSGSGGPMGDTAPAVTPVVLPPVVEVPPSPPSGADVGVGFGWD
jgi:hypothetical protein